MKLVNDKPVEDRLWTIYNDGSMTDLEKAKALRLQYEQGDERTHGTVSAILSVFIVGTSQKSAATPAAYSYLLEHMPVTAITMMVDRGNVRNEVVDTGAEGTVNDYTDLVIAASRLAQRDSVLELVDKAARSLDEVYFYFLVMSNAEREEHRRNDVLPQLALFASKTVEEFWMDVDSIIDHYNTYLETDTVQVPADADDFAKWAVKRYAEALVAWINP